MEPPEIKTSDTQTGGTPFQYSLRTMFILMTALAIVLSGIFAGPDWLSVMVGWLLGILAPMALTVGITYGRGYLRTFCIGGLFPAGVVFFGVALAVADVWYSNLPWMQYYSPPPGDSRWTVGLSVLTDGIVIIASGLVATLLRWMIEGPQRRQRREASLREQTSQISAPAAPTWPES
jgi:hypothetical protein